LQDYLNLPKDAILSLPSPTRKKTVYMTLIHLKKPLSWPKVDKLVVNSIDNINRKIQIWPTITAYPNYSHPKISYVGVSSNLESIGKIFTNSHMHVISPSLKVVQDLLCTKLFALNLRRNKKPMLEASSQVPTKALQVVVRDWSKVYYPKRRDSWGI